MSATVKITSLLMALCLLSFDLSRSKSATLLYIDQYKSIIINESVRTGIPASIKMAQAIVESGSGTSTLAREHNNHFGIKCGGMWNGKKAFREDDDYKGGILVKSCFRSYEDPATSFFDHSEFLLGSSRYAFLFLIEKTDYHSWAHGLKSAGYATDPTYADKLIKIIEEYSLYEWDTDESILASKFLVKKPENRMDEMEEIEKSQNINTATEQHQPTRESDITSIIAKTENVHSTRTYTVRKGEDMTIIASKFNMDVKELYIKNRIPFDRQVKVGEKLVINEYIHMRSLPQVQKINMSEEKYLWEETLVFNGK